MRGLYQYDNSYEEGETLDFYIKGFIEGAKWADSHSENIWHKVIESPKEFSIILIEYQDIMAFDPFYDFVYIIDSQTFSDVVNEKDVLHWAYLEDVIKKLK